MNLGLNITFGGVPVHLIVLISLLFLIVSNVILIVKNGTEIADVTNGKFPIQFCYLLGLRLSTLGTNWYMWHSNRNSPFSNEWLWVVIL